jgi:hypothetical protein
MPLLGSLFGRKKNQPKSKFAIPKVKGPKNKKAISTMKNLIVFTQSKNFNKSKLNKYSLNNLLYAITAVSGPRVNNYNRNTSGNWFVIRNQSNLTKNKLLNNIALAPPMYYKNNLNQYKKNGSQYAYYLNQYFPNRKR